MYSAYPLQLQLRLFLAAWLLMPSALPPPLALPDHSLRELKARSQSHPWLCHADH